VTSGETAADATKRRDKDGVAPGVTIDQEVHDHKW